MKIALISDIHSNYTALKECVNKIESEGIADKIYCLGDIIGYGPNPSECLNLVLNISELNLMGNHEDALFHTETLGTFNSNAQAAIEYTRERVSAEEKKIIKKFKYTYKDKNAYYSHSSFFQPENWLYLFRKFEIEDELQRLDFGKPLFFGHSHRPMVITQNEENKYFANDFSEPIKIEKKYKYIINIGSVGQPRDGDPDSSFAVFDTKNKTAVLHRVKYDVEKVYKEIKNNKKLPDILGERLLYGK